MEHQVRVYHEDTDFLGIVYYANYFKYLERGRTESIRDLENFHTLKNSFAVSNICADFKSPAKFNDLLTVTTKLDYIKNATVGVNQIITRDTEFGPNEDLIFLATVRLAYVNNGKPTRIPQDVKDTLREQFE
tara:strand:- start:305 stop:700 length:396 start_codon:yes stop_codon:yes gene_type:complete